MFVVNTEIEVNFLLPGTTANVSNTDYDVKVVKPNGESDYYSQAIQSENFIAPTENTLGAAAYKFTPDTEGVWIVALVQGTSELSGIYYEYPLRISSPDTHVHQQVDLG